MTTVFVSWSRETEQVAQALSQWLSELALDTNTWFSSVDLVAGQRWHDELKLALGRANCAIACLGPSSVRSPWVLYETAAMGQKGPVIPMALQIAPNCLPPTLTEFQILNAFPSASIRPAADLPKRLRAALGASCAISFKSGMDAAEADARLVAAHETYGLARVNQIRALLRATRRADMLVDLLRHVRANPGISLKNLADGAGLEQLFGKKYILACAVFWLREQFLIEVSGFENVTDGQVKLAYDADLLLGYLDDTEGPQHAGRR